MCVKESCALDFYIFPYLMKGHIPPKQERFLLAVMQPYEKARSAPNWIAYKLKTLVIAGAFSLPFQAHTHFDTFLPVTF